jgi:hypothetical protein
MATFTLADAQKLGLNDLQAGIAESIVTVAPAIGALPFMKVAGNAYAFNRESQLISGQAVAADGTITDSTELQTNLVNVQLSAISGQSDIPNAELRQRIGENAGNDLVAIHLKAAAKGVAREFLQRIITGTVANNGWDGLDALLASAAFASQVEDAANGAFSLDLVDAAMSRLDVRPQYFMGNGKAEAAFKKAMRSAGGVDTVELNGVYFTSYDGVPFIRNDYIPSDVVSGTAGNQTNIYMGTWGDGTNLGGATCLTSASADLFSVQKFDQLEGKDATRIRVIMDGAFTVFSPLQVAKLANVTV